jgi:hypothetical protein
MDFSEYTLVSFGDSFTFGEDTVPAPDFTTVQDSTLADTVVKRYKSDCNKNSYTQFLAESLGFKDSLNFGTRGSSNERSMTNLESFLRSNPKKKIFVLFNFTQTSRYVQFFKEEKGEEYSVEDMLSHHPDLPLDSPKYIGINSKIIAQNWTYFRNSMQDVYSHVTHRRMVYYILSSYNIPYVTFDGINDTDAVMIKNNSLKYINKKNIGGGYGNFMYNDDENYVFKEMDFLNSYYQELIDKSPLLTHLVFLNSHELEVENMHTYIRTLAKSHPFNNPDYFTGPTGHWNTEGHIEVAKLIEKFINERYN